MGIEIIDIDLISEANIKPEIVFEVQDPNNVTVSAPQGLSKRITLDLLSLFTRTKAIVVPVGANQAAAFELIAYDNVADVVAAGTGLRLLSNSVGYEVMVNNNDGAEAVLVYPVVGGTMEGEAINDPVSVAPGNTFIFKIYEVNKIRIT